MSLPTREAVKVVADCLQAQIAPALSPKTVTIALAYQKITIPAAGLMVALFNLASDIIPSDNTDGSGAGLVENQSAVLHDTIQIDLLSFDDSARSMRAIAAMALQGLFAESLQETYQIKIAQKPGPFRDTSSLEPTQYIQRYTTTIQTLSIQVYALPADYYSTFPQTTEVLNP